MVIIKKSTLKVGFFSKLLQLIGILIITFLDAFKYTALCLLCCFALPLYVRTFVTFVYNAMVVSVV